MRRTAPSTSDRVGSPSLLMTKRTRHAAVKEQMSVVNQCASLNKLYDSRVSASQTTCDAALMHELPQE
jgi:hypothetical protein